MFRPSRLERLADCMRGRIGPEIDWVDIVKTANEALVGPSLYRALLGSGRLERVDADALAYLAAIDAANQERNRRLWAQLLEVATALNAARVVPMLIKGATEIERHPQPSASARMLTDVDVLIEPEELPLVEEAFAGLGFRAIEDTACAHSPGSYWRPGAAGAIDLHTSLPVRMAEVIGREDLAAHSVERTREGARYRVPDASLRLALGVSHNMLHDQNLLRGTTALRDVLDFAASVEAGADPIDWTWIGRLRRNRRFPLAFETQAAMASHLLGTPPLPLGPPTQFARALHWRRRAKIRHELLGRVEWSLLRRVLRLSRVLVAMISVAGDRSARAKTRGRNVTTS